MGLAIQNVRGGVVNESLERVDRKQGGDMRI